MEIRKFVEDLRKLSNVTIVSKEYAKGHQVGCYSDPRFAVRRLKLLT